jgi:hypothetical protein
MLRIRISTARANGLKYQVVPGGGEVPVEPARQDVQDGRASQGQVRTAHQSPQDQRRSGDQRCVERQHVEVDRLVPQRERLPDQDVGVLEEVMDVEFVLIQGVVEFPNRAGDLGREQQDSMM